MKRNLKLIAWYLVIPSTQAIEAGCTDDDDCPDYNACDNRGACVNPCAEQDACAPLATCSVVRHQVVCACPDGFIGDPQFSCIKRKNFGLLHYNIYNTMILFNAYYSFLKLVINNCSVFK